MAAEPDPFKSKPFWTPPNKNGNSWVDEIAGLYGDPAAQYKLATPPNPELKKSGEITNPKLKKFLEAVEAAKAKKDETTVLSWTQQNKPVNWVDVSEPPATAPWYQQYSTTTTTPVDMGEGYLDTLDVAAVGSKPEQTFSDDGSGYLTTNQWIWSEANNAWFKVPPSQDQTSKNVNKQKEEPEPVAEDLFDEPLVNETPGHRAAYWASSKAYEELHVLLAADQPWIAAAAAEPSEIFGILSQVIEDQKHLEADLVAINAVDRAVGHNIQAKCDKLFDFESLALLLEKTWNETAKCPNKRPHGIEAKFALCKALGLYGNVNRPPINDRRLVLFLQNAHTSLKEDEKEDGLDQHSLAIIQLWSKRLGEMGINVVCHLHPTATIDKTINHYFARVSYDPPNLEGRRAIIQHFAEANLEEAEATPEVLETLAGVVSGLQPTQIEQALSRCLAMKGTIDIPQVLALKTEILNDSSALRVLQPEFGFDKIGGLEGIRDFVVPMLTKKSKSGKRRPKGVVLLGVGGTGKSMFCKALGKATGRTTMVLDIGSLFGKYVGDTEGRLRHALGCIEASSPCILMLDELEKAIGGSGESHEVSQRARGTLMTWLNDRPNDSDVFVVATINDITLLPPEFCRSERFDAVFFVDLPNDKQKKDIWNIWMKHYELEEQETPDDAGWTGAEISSCCGLADLLGKTLLEASNYVVPLSKSQGEAVGRQQDWAEGRCVDASTGKTYVRDNSNKGSSVADAMMEEGAADVAVARRRIQRPTRSRRGE